MAKFEYHAIEQVDFTGKPLIIPGLGIGNAGQLALDMLLNNTTKPYRIVGRVLSTHIQPIVGIDALTNVRCNITTGIELFIAEGLPAVLQIRATIAQRRGPDFVEKILEWAQSSGFSNIVILGSISEEIKVRFEDPAVFHMKNEACKEELADIPGKDLKTEDEHDRLEGCGLVKRCLKKEIDYPILSLLVYARDMELDIESAQMLIQSWQAYSGNQAVQVVAPSWWENIALF